MSAEIICGWVIYLNANGPQGPTTTTRPEPRYRRRFIENDAPDLRIREDMVIWALGGRIVVGPTGVRTSLVRRVDGVWEEVSSSAKSLVGIEAGVDPKSAQRFEPVSLRRQRTETEWDCVEM
jgi:hypothetical protein